MPEAQRLPLPCNLKSQSRQGGADLFLVSPCSSLGTKGQVLGSFLRPADGRWRQRPCQDIPTQVCQNGAFTNGLQGAGSIMVSLLLKTSVLSKFSSKCFGLTQKTPLICQ